MLVFLLAALESDDATKTEGFKVKGGTAFGTMTLIKLAGML